MSFLLDTSVISELVKPTPDDNVVEWMKRAEETSLYLSVLTIATRNTVDFERCGAHCFNPWMPG